MVDEELIRQFQNGETDAFRVLYDRYAPAVYRYVRFRVKSDADAEDITIEVFTRAWKALPKYKWQGVPFSAWLFRISHNLIVDRTRPKRFSFINLSTWIRSNGHHEYERIEDQDVISRAFGSLSYEEQLIIYLSFYESYTNKEVAEVIGKTVSATGVAKFRALKRLNKVLGNADA
ncbi:MAG: sigma-70 family RNA polymerase sigma factor [Caldilineaceae bacterium]|nr:sigma-70 family RNA polymerase sigma factor [Caldilineaceae bacterium]